MKVLLELIRIVFLFVIIGWNDKCHVKLSVLRNRNQYRCLWLDGPFGGSYYTFCTI